jgi:hypothetical protein
MRYTTLRRRMPAEVASDLQKGLDTLEQTGAIHSDERKRISDMISTNPITDKRVSGRK